MRGEGLRVGLDGWTDGWMEGRTDGWQKEKRWGYGNEWGCEGKGRGNELEGGMGWVVAGLDMCVL